MGKKKTGKKIPKNWSSYLESSHWVKSVVDGAQRKDRLPLDWSGTNYQKELGEYLDKVEEQAGFPVSFLLGVWTDEHLAKAVDTDVHKITTLRRLAGIPALTMEQDKHIENILGPLIRSIEKHGDENQAVDLRRWALRLKSRRNSWKRWQTGGPNIWAKASTDIYSKFSAKRLAPRNCYTCNRWNGLHELTNNVPIKDTKSKHGAYCSGRNEGDSKAEVVGRAWLHKHGGTIGRQCAPWFTNCPAWEAVRIENSERARRPFMAQTFEVFWVKAWRSRASSPFPFKGVGDPMRIMLSTRWAFLMDRMREQETP